MKSRSRWIPLMFALAAAIPGVSQAATTLQSMKAFDQCTLSPALAVYHDATIAAQKLARYPRFYLNKQPGAPLNEESWLYALYASQVLPDCALPSNPADAKKAMLVRKAAREIISEYIDFTWTPTRRQMAFAWPAIKGAYDKVGTIIGPERDTIKVPQGMIADDGTYDAMIHMKLPVNDSVTVK